MAMKNIGDAVYRFYFTRCVWLIKFWYRLTMALTKVDQSVYLYGNAHAIVQDLGSGTRYEPDPWYIDYMAHPSRVMSRILSSSSVGDCDDHAAFIATALLKNGLADRAWIAFIAFRNIDNKLMGHALCVYEKGGKTYWCDYREPAECVGWMWVASVCAQRDYAPIAAALIEVDKIGKNDTPVFGDCKSISL